MGNDCSPEERLFRYEAFHQAIYAIENDINKELYNQDLSNKKYMPFGLINQGLCRKYQFLLNEKFDKNIAKNKILKYNDLEEETDEKDFSYINKDFEFTFPSNFIFINKDFMDVIRDYVPEKYKKNSRTNYDTIIGGGCLIMKNQGDRKDTNPFRYIILYNAINENKGNEVNFILYIKDKEERELAVAYILKYNLSNYFQHMKYNYKDEFKKFYGKKNEAGYIIRNSDPSHFEKYFNKMNEKKQINSQNNLNPSNQQQNAANIHDVSNQQQNPQNLGNNQIPLQSPQNFVNNQIQQQNPQNFVIYHNETLKIFLMFQTNHKAFKILEIFQINNQI